MIHLVECWLCAKQDLWPITLGMENLESNSVTSPKSTQTKQMSQTNGVGELGSWLVAQKSSAEHKPHVLCAWGTPHGACFDPQTSTPLIGSLEEAEEC